MAYNKQSVLRTNIEAIETAIRITKELRSPSPAEIRILLSYRGFGGLPFILYPLDNRKYWESHGATQYYEDTHRLYDLIDSSPMNTTEVWRALRSSVLTSFYTPENISESIVSVISDSLKDAPKILEPSAGMGVFVNMCHKSFPMSTVVDAVELDPLTSYLLSVIYKDTESIQIHEGGFEKIYQNDNPIYDLVLSNVPFGNYGVSDSHYNSQKGIKQQSTKLIHRYFILKGLDQLRSGGVLCYIVPRGILDSSEKSFKEALMNQSHLLSYQRLPDGLFSETAGTKIGSDLLILQKREQLDTNINVHEIDFIESSIDPTTGRNSFYEKYKSDQLSDKTIEKTDQYGKPTIVYQFSGSNLSLSLYSFLRSDMTAHFSNDIYNHHLGLPSFRSKSEDKDYGLDIIEDPTDLLPDRLMQSVPDLYSTEQTPSSECIAYLRYFHPLSDYTAYLLEYNSSDRLGFGYVSLGGDFELGYISLPELKSLNIQGLGIERDIYFTPSKISEIEELKVVLDDNLYIEDTSAPRSVASPDYSRLEISEDGLPLSIPDVIENEHSTNVISPEKNRQLSLFDTLDDFITEVPNQEKQTVENRSPVPYSGKFRYLQDRMLVQEGNLFGEYRTTDGLVYPIPVNSFTRDQLIAYIKVRDIYLELRNEEQRYHIEQIELRSNLNKFYDDYVHRYGTFTSTKLRSKIKKDPVFLDLKNLEIEVDGQIIKSDIFSKPVSFSPDPTNIDSAKEALYYSINAVGRIDFDLMLSLYSKENYDKENLIEELRDYILYDVDSNSYVLKEMYIRGNVISKQDKVDAFLHTHPGHSEAQRTLDALEASIPTAITYEELDFNLGERWIPVSYYSDFLSSLYKASVSVDYIAASDTFTVHVEGMNAAMANEYMIRRHSTDGRSISPGDLAQMSLQDTNRFLTKKITVSSPTSPTGFQSVDVPDIETTNLLESKISKIRTEFKWWMKGIPNKDQLILQDRYNRLFNSNVIPHYDGSHQTFPDLNFQNAGFDDLYTSQKDAIWMLKLNGGGICDHTVGGGKTAIMCVASYEMKRLGYVQRPMIIGLKANISEIAATYRRLYPNARILAPSVKETTKKNISEFLSKMKNNDYDCVILSHNQFESIPQDPEVLMSLLNDELMALEDAIATRNAEMSEDYSLKEMERSKKSLETRIANLQDSISKRQYSTLPTFNELGIDHLFVDESHTFKNLFYVTKHNNVSGLGQKDGSQRAMNLYTAIRTIQERNGCDLGASFFSGTTITNSLTELYILFKYLRPQELERQQINSFDSWAAVFAEKSVEYEVTGTSQIKPKCRFRKFIKVPELVNFYSEVWERKVERSGLSVFDWYSVCIALIG